MISGDKMQEAVITVTVMPIIQTEMLATMMTKIPRISVGMMAIQRNQER